MEIIGNLFFWANRPCPIFWVWCFREPLFQGWRWSINLWIQQMLLNNRNKALRLHLYVKYRARGITLGWHDAEYATNQNSLNLKQLPTTHNLVWHVKNAPKYWKYERRMTVPIWLWHEYDKDSHNFSQRKWWVKSTWRLKQWQVIF